MVGRLIHKARTSYCADKQLDDGTDSLIIAHMCVRALAPALCINHNAHVLHVEGPSISCVQQCMQMGLANTRTAVAVVSPQLLSLISLLNHHQLSTTIHRLGGTSLVGDPHRPIRRDYRGHRSDGVLRQSTHSCNLFKACKAKKMK